MSQIAILKSTLANHNLVKSVAFNPAGTILATGSIDNTAKLWRFEPDGSAAICVATLAGHSGAVYSVSFHPTAPLLATGSQDKTAKLWRFSPDGSTATCVATLAGHNGSVNSVAFHPTAPLLATGSIDNTAKLWRFEPDESAATCVATLEGHNDFVLSVAFHPTAPLLATGSRNNIVKLWNFSPDGSSANCVANLAGHRNSVSSVAFNPAGTILATGSIDNTAKLWRFEPDGSAANCVATLAGQSGYVMSVAFHPTAPLLATGFADNTVKLWNFSPDGSSANCVATLAGHRDAVYSVAFHPTAPLLATGSSDKTAKIWELNIQNLSIVSSNSSASASVQNRPSVSASANNSGLIIYMNDETKVIEIKEKLLKPTRNLSNNSCPSFMPLYLKIMAIDLKGEFRFKFQNQPAFDAGGLKRFILDKLLPVYTNNFFDSIKKNHEFVILKDMPINKTFKHNTDQLILLADKAGAKIFLRIDPRLLDLLLSPDLKKYFSNNKKNNFTKFYEFINKALHTPNYDELNNNSDFLRIKKNSNQKNRVINQYKKEQQQKIKNDLLSEIRLRRFLAECGFSSWEQVQNMYLFIQQFWNPENFSSELKFDIESFSKNLKILKQNNDDNYTEIPLDKFVKLSKNNSMKFDFNNLNNKILTIYSDYSFFRPFLNYILGPKSTDEIRKLFVNYVAGTIYYPGELKLVLSHQTATYPFKSETCFKKLMFYKNNPEDPQMQINNATKFIEKEIKPNNGSVNFGLV